MKDKIHNYVITIHSQFPFFSEAKLHTISWLGITKYSLILCLNLCCYPVAPIEQRSKKYHFLYYTYIHTYTLMYITCLWQSLQLKKRLLLHENRQSKIFRSKIWIALLSPFALSTVHCLTISDSTIGKQHQDTWLYFSVGKILRILKFLVLEYYFYRRGSKSMPIKVFYSKSMFKVSSKGRSTEPCGWSLMEYYVQYRTLQGGILWVKIKSIFVSR